MMQHVLKPQQAVDSPYSSFTDDAFSRIIKFTISS
jgi:hypothetical protein